MTSSPIGQMVIENTLNIFEAHQGNIYSDSGFDFFIYIRKMMYVIIGISLLLLLNNFFIPVKKIKKHGPARIFLFPVLKKLRDEFPLYNIVIENDGRVKYEFQSSIHNFSADFIYMRSKIQLTVSANVNKFHVCENYPYDVDEIDLAINVILRTLQFNSLVS